MMMMVDEMVNEMVIFDFENFISSSHDLIQPSSIIIHHHPSHQWTIISSIGKMMFLVVWLIVVREMR